MSDKKHESEEEENEEEEPENVGDEDEEDVDEGDEDVDAGPTMRDLMSGKYVSRHGLNYFCALMNVFW